jgi:hypothetical protein
MPQLSSAPSSGTLTDLHFGFGSVETVAEIDVTWPTGETQRFHNVPARKVYRLRRGERLEPVPLSPSPRPPTPRSVVGLSQAGASPDALGRVRAIIGFVSTGRGRKRE